MSRRGFTLIELLVVISIISLLSSVVLASLNSAREKGRISAGRQFDSNMYHAEADQAVGIWDFDECSGTTVGDRSGTGNIGTFVGSPAWSTDTFSGSGCSLLLNGTSDYVSLVNNGSLNLTSTFTVSAWIKPSASATANWNMIVAGSFSDWALGFNGAVNSIRLTKVTVADALISNVVMSRVAWHQVAMVYSGSTVTYYVDGQAAGSGSFSQTFTPGAKFIGQAPGYPSFFGGNIDSVRVYAKDLTAMEVGKIYALDRERGRALASSH